MVKCTCTGMAILNETKYREEISIDDAMLARRAVAVAEDKQASDIMMLDVRGLTTVTDYFVLCTAPSDRQLRAVMRALDEELSKAGGRQPRIEGLPETGWVIMDFGGVVVHMFAPEQREFYRLERLWKQAQPVVVVQ